MSCYERSAEKNRKDTGKTLYGRGIGVYNERKILGNGLSQGLLIFFTQGGNRNENS